MLEKEIVLTVSDMRLLTIALTSSSDCLRGFSWGHIKHLSELLKHITANYTADRTVKLMVFKEPLLR